MSRVIAAESSDHAQTADTANSAGRGEARRRRADPSARGRAAAAATPAKATISAARGSTRATDQASARAYHQA